MDKYTLIDDYIKPRQSSVSAVNNKLDDLVPRQPFKVSFLDWKRVNVLGEEHIEYLINIDYTEG